jgi:hypothetical protein
VAANTKLFPLPTYIQIYVKSSVLSQAPDLAISAHLMTEAEIDEFVDEHLLNWRKSPRCEEGASRGIDPNRPTPKRPLP